MKSLIVSTLLFPLKASLSFLKVLYKEMVEGFNEVMAQFAYADLQRLHKKFEANGLHACRNQEYSKHVKYCTHYQEALDYHSVEGASSALASIEHQVNHIVEEFNKAFKSPVHLTWWELVRLIDKGKMVFEVLEGLNSDFEYFLIREDAGASF